MPASYPKVKRFVDAWFCDPDFPDRFRERPTDALRDLGVDLDSTELAHLVSPEDFGILTDPTREDGVAEVGGIVSDWRRYARERYQSVKTERDHRTPGCPALANWRWRQITRLKFELAPSLGDQIRHIPFAMELTRGCSGRCWFCGVSAQPLDGMFDRSPENVVLFRGLLQHLVSIHGRTAALDGILYWATDPLDHPDYESFVEDFAEIVGGAPATVTALGGRKPERAASVLATLSRYPARSHRFSVLSVRDYRTLISWFDASELALVEMLPQFRKDLRLKFAAGRARTRMKAKGTSEDELRPGGTIACLSGVMVDFVGRTIRLVTPCPSSDARPDGVHESARIPFERLEDAIEVIDRLLDEIRIPLPNEGAMLARSQGVRFADSPDSSAMRVVSDHHAIRLSSPISGDRLEAELPTSGTIDSIVETLVGALDLEPLEAVSLLRRLLDAGAIRAGLPGEGAMPVQIGVPDTGNDQEMTSPTEPG